VSVRVQRSDGKELEDEFEDDYDFRTTGRVGIGDRSFGAELD
jgi:hypothetical protein